MDKPEALDCMDIDTVDMTYESNYINQAKRVS